MVITFLSVISGRRCENMSRQFEHDLKDGGMGKMRDNAST